MQGFSLSTTVQVLPCPNCKETINTSMQVCPFCSAPIDHDAAEASADAFAKVNQACSDASYLKIMAGTALTFWLLRFVPFLSLIGIVGFIFLEIAIPVMAIRWWVKFGSVRTDDPDFSRARRTTMLVGIGAVLVILIVEIGSFVI
jgi:hypothetical protein